MIDSNGFANIHQIHQPYDQNARSFTKSGEHLFPLTRSSTPQPATSDTGFDTTAERPPAKNQKFDVDGLIFTRDGRTC